MYGCDLTFVFPQFKRRDLRSDRLRQFPVVRRFDTLWTMNDQWTDASKLATIERFSGRPSLHGYGCSSSDLN
jgi:hypothetical protein